MILITKGSQYDQYLNNLTRVNRETQNLPDLVRSVVFYYAKRKGQILESINKIPNEHMISVNFTDFYTKEPWTLLFEATLHGFSVQWKYSELIKSSSPINLSFTENYIKEILQ